MWKEAWQQDFPLAGEQAAISKSCETITYSIIEIKEERSEAIKKKWRLYLWGNLVKLESVEY